MKTAKYRMLHKSNWVVQHQYRLFIKCKRHPMPLVIFENYIIKHASLLTSQRSQGLPSVMCVPEASRRRRGWAASRPRPSPPGWRAVTTGTPPPPGNRSPQLCAAVTETHGWVRTTGTPQPPGNRSPQLCAAVTKTHGWVRQVCWFYTVFNTV